RADPRLRAAPRLAPIGWSANRAAGTCIFRSTTVTLYYRVERRRTPGVRRNLSHGRAGVACGLQENFHVVTAENAFFAGTLLRRLRRRRRVALSSQARDQIILVPDLAGAGGRPGAGLAFAGRPGR